MTSSNALKSIVTAARPLLEQLIDVTEQIAALRDTATMSGIDWSQMKALLKAQIQDERDGKDRVAKLIEKAEFACAYAGMLGLGGKMNEGNYNSEPLAAPSSQPVPVKAAPAPHMPSTEDDASLTAAYAGAADPLDLPSFLRRGKAA